MKIKIILLIFLFVCGLAPVLFAQSVNIWDVTFDFLVKNGYSLPDGYRRPTKTNDNYIVYPYFIYGQNGSIDDPNFIIPNDSKLDSYSFGSIFRQHYTHLLFVKNGKYRIINMGKTLPDIIMQSCSLCNDLGLDDNELVDVINEVIRYYNDHKKGLESMGVPISSKADDVD